LIANQGAAAGSEGAFRVVKNRCFRHLVEIGADAPISEQTVLGQAGDEPVFLNGAGQFAGIGVAFRPDSDLLVCLSP
jgi:hypothetical protein